MTIFCLGTSNFIVGGSYIEHFTSVIDEAVLNVSVGASPSATAMYFLSRLPLAAGDVVLLDYAINDNSYLAHDVCSPERVTRNMGSAVAHIAEMGAIPIIIVNPEAAGFIEPTPAEHVHVAFADAAGVPLLNLAQLFRKSLERGTRQSALMRDEAHHSVGVAPLVAKILSHAVATVRLQPPKLDLAWVSLCMFRSIDVAPLVPPERRLQRMSALRSAQMASLKEGETMTIAVADTEVVRGIMINFGAPGAMIEISGPTGRLVASLVTDWDNLNPLSFMSALVEFRMGVRGGREGVQIRVLSRDAQPTEPIIHRRAHHPDLYGEAQIEGVLVAAEDPRATDEEPRSRLRDILAGQYERLALELKDAAEEATVPAQ